MTNLTKSFVIDNVLYRKIEDRMMELHFSQFTDYILTLIRKDIFRNNRGDDVKQKIMVLLTQVDELMVSLETINDQKAKEVVTEESKLKKKFKDSEALRQLIASRKAKLEEKT